MAPFRAERMLPRYSRVTDADADRQQPDSAVPTSRRHVLLRTAAALGLVATACTMPLVREMHASASAPAPSAGRRRNLMSSIAHAAERDCGLAASNPRSTLPGLASHHFPAPAAALAAGRLSGNATAAARLLERYEPCARTEQRRPILTFVLGEDVPPTSGVWHHRGIGAAHLTGAHALICAEAVAEVASRRNGAVADDRAGMREAGDARRRVYIHVKDRCDALVEADPAARHLLDKVDSDSTPGARFVGQLFGTEEELRAAPPEGCATPLCVRLPHHFNLPYSAEDEAPSSFSGVAAFKRHNGAVGIVGTALRDGLAAWLLDSLQAVMRLQWPGPRGVVEELRPAVDATLLTESEFTAAADPHPTGLEVVRRFFHSLCAAVAWKSRKPVNSVSGGQQRAGRLRYKPGERFTNPIVYGVPTTGHRSYYSFAHYEHAGPFLCADAPCVRNVIGKLAAGELDAPFAALVAEVTADVDPLLVGLSYLLLAQAAVDLPVGADGQG